MHKYISKIFATHHSKSGHKQRHYILVKQFILVAAIFKTLIIKMWFRLFIFGTVLVVATTAAELSVRPKNCTPGTTYKKDCNVCTCATDPKKDKCGNVDCSRSSSTTTVRPSSTARPGVCPSVVTPRPGTNDCKTRTQTSTCNLDKDCPGAKKCCENGCKIKSCRNAIYKNTP